MTHLPRSILRLLPALAAAAAIAAVSTPAASAETRTFVWLNEQTGVLSIIGTDDHSDEVYVDQIASPSSPGGSAIEVHVKSQAWADFSTNCTEGGAAGDWFVYCPAVKVKKLTFDGKGLDDSFYNTTSLPSEAHGGPGQDWFVGGSGNDVLYGDGADDHLEGNGGDDIIDGGAGVDVSTGGAGTDIASWADATGPVTASLDNLDNDGPAGESEHIPTDFEGLQGGPYNDKLTGSAGPDHLLGGEGNDDLDGLGGDDIIEGQGGSDTLHPGPGTDKLFGGTGTDTLSYANSPGPVYVYQDGQANDGMLGEHDNVLSIEDLTGSAYGDDLEGTTGNDTIDGGAGNDKIMAKFGDDTVYGGDGSDHIGGGPGAPTDCGNLPCTQFDTDAFFGGAGDDTIDYSDRSDKVTIALDASSKSGGFMENDTLSSFEDAVGGGGDDTIYGNAYSNSLIGNGGGNSISGGGGNDYVSGGAGLDSLSGGGGDDWIDGGADNDTLDAAGGNDTLYGGSGRDRVTYYWATAGVTAHIGTGTSGQAGESDKIEPDVEDLQGSVYGDHLYGSAGANLLDGLGGPDTLVGNGGPDTLEGGDGADTLSTNGDGVQDHSSCGAGGDKATIDKIDVADSDCETVAKI